MPKQRDVKIKAASIPQGIKLLHKLKGQPDWINCLVVTPDGKSVISGSDHGVVQVWELESGQLLREMEHSRGEHFSLAVTPDGKSVISGNIGGIVRVWALESGRLLHTIKGHNGGVFSLAVTPDARFLISGDHGGTVRVYELESGELLRTMEGHHEAVFSLALTPDGRCLISSGEDRTIRVWELKSGQLLRTMEGHRDSVLSAEVMPDGCSLVSSSQDGTVRVWELESGRLLRTIEGHPRWLSGLAMSPDGKWLASVGVQETIDLPAVNSIWEVDSGRRVEFNNERITEKGFRICGRIVSFSPKGSFLVTASPGYCVEDTGVSIWQIDFGVLTRELPHEEPVRYCNAKVVLVGDTGVGKSGLGMVLAGEAFQPTDSTHGRRVWLFESKKVPLPTGESQTREVLLWDLAGQPGYRLVHQLNIDQATIALVLVDARSETDPLGPAEYWARAIAQARSALPITKFLVVARVDRGGLAVSQDDLQRFAQKFGYAEVFQTSAKNGKGVQQLSQAIRKGIHWNKLEEVTSTQLLTAIKQFLQREKERGDAAIVDEMETLFRRYVSGIRERAGDHRLSEPSLADFRTCVRCLEAPGLVEILRFRALEEGISTVEYVLLQPEYIDAYASAAVITARDDPRGIGHVLESNLLAGQLHIDDKERIPNSNIERLVLTVTIERLLTHDIALRERLADGDYLVFPSEYTRSAPYPRHNEPGVAFDFEGATRAIFTTLVVRLAHHRDFAKTDFYRDAACYDTATGGRCAVVLDDKAPGQGRMSVYFENTPSQTEQQAFLRFVRQHLEDKAKTGSVHLHRIYCCRACGHPWAENVVENRLRQGKQDIVCPNCDERSPLFDLLVMDTEQTRNEASQMYADAEAARRRQVAAIVIEGKKRIGEYDVLLSYNSADRSQVVELAEALSRLGLRPWLDVWDLVPGRHGRRRCRRQLSM